MVYWKLDINATLAAADLESGKLESIFTTETQTAPDSRKTMKTQQSFNGHHRPSNRLRCRVRKSRQISGADPGFQLGRHFMFHHTPTPSFFIAPPLPYGLTHVARIIESDENTTLT